VCHSVGSVPGSGRNVDPAARRPGAPAPRAIEAAVDDLPASPHAEAGDLILDGAERPLLRDGRGTLALDARLRRVALHVLAVAEAARLLLSPANDRPRAPVA
jgi:hypothetical protein